MRSQAAPARSGTWLKCNFDTGASITAVPKKYHENPQEKSGDINGNATDVHSQGALHQGRRHDYALGPPGVQGDGRDLRAMSRRDDKGRIPLLEEGGVYNFYLEMDPETDEGAASSEPGGDGAGLGATPKSRARPQNGETAVEGAALEARRRKRCVGAGGGTTWRLPKNRWKPGP